MSIYKPISQTSNQPFPTLEAVQLFQKHPQLANQDNLCLLLSLADKNDPFLAAELTRRINLQLTIEQLFPQPYQSFLSTQPTQADLGQWAWKDIIPLGPAIGTGALTFVPVMRTSHHIVVLGPTGTGKTTCIIVIVAFGVGKITSIVFDKKLQLRSVGLLNKIRRSIKIFKLRELKIPLLRPAPGQSLSAHRNILVRTLARTFNLYASRRFALESLVALDRSFNLMNEFSHNHQPVPMLRDWYHFINRWEIKGQHPTGYRDVLSFVLLTLLQNAGGKLFECESSNIYDELFEPYQLSIIEGEDISAEVWSFVILLILNELSARRLKMKEKGVTPEPALFVVDDALNLLSRARDQAAEAGINPLAEELLIIRWLNIGLMMAAQNPSFCSELVLGNAENIFCFGAWTGSDLLEMKKLFNLDNEQLQVFKTLSVGHAVGMVRSIWPHPFVFSVPEII